MEIDNLRLLIIAGDPLARAGLAALLDQQPGCTVVGQLAAEGNLPANRDLYEPDIVLWDLGWNPDPSLPQLADLRDLDLPVVLLLPGETLAAEVWAAGPRGLLLRDAPAEQLVAALQAAAQGLIILDPALAAVLPQPQPGSSQPVEALTARESEVLQLLAEGLPNKTIAARLGISEHTIKFHVNAIMGKLGAQSRTEAVVRATQAGLIML